VAGLERILGSDFGAVQAVRENSERAVVCGRDLLRALSCASHRHRVVAARDRGDLLGIRSLYSPGASGAR